MWEDFIFGADVKARAPGLRGGRASPTAALQVPITRFEDPAAVNIPPQPDLIVNPFSFGSYRNFFVMYCSFVDGFDRGARLPLLIILKTKYLLSQAVAFTAFGVSLSPWLAKPFIAVVTDTVPIFGLRRKPYIIGSAGVNATALGLIGYFADTQIGGFMVPMSLMTLRTFCRGVTGSVIQGMLLEDCQDSGQSRTSVFVSQYHTAHRLGQFLSVVVSGVLLTATSLTTIFLSMSAFHAGSILLSLVLEEPTVAAAEAGTMDAIPTKIQELRETAIDSPQFNSLLQYAFWAMASPTYEARLAYYLLDERAMSVWQVSLVTTAQTVAATITPSVYSMFFQNSQLRPLLKQFTLWTLPASLLPLLLTTGVSDQLGLNQVAVAAVSGFCLTLATDLQMMPANVLIAQLATKGLEGASYSVFTVTEGIGRVCSNFYSGLVPVLLGASDWNGYTNMTLYVLASAGFQLAPYHTIAGCARAEALTDEEPQAAREVHNKPGEAETYITDDEEIIN